MRLKTLIALVVVLALVPVVGGAYAASGKKAGKHPVAHMLRRHALLKESASYLGITVQQLHTQLKAGRSLAQIADGTSGRSSAGLLADLAGAVKAKLDGLVTAGKLKAERESKLLDRVTQRLQKRLAHVHAVKS